MGASPAVSLLLEDRPTIDVENAWGLDATSFGNHEFDYGLERILAQQARSDFPWLSANIVAEDTGEAPDWIRPSAVFRVNGVRVGVIGATVRSTPELVRTGNTAGLAFLDEAERIERESRALRRRGVRVQVVVIHEGATVGANAVDGQPAVPWDGPIKAITEALGDTTVDLVIAGHTHRAANTVIAGIPVVEGFNAGASYSVAQLLVRRGDVAWAGAATRVAKNQGVAPRADVKAIVDAADAETAPQRNEVIGTQVGDILRDPTRLSESAMGNLVADAIRLKYPDAEAALTNSGGLRADLRFNPPAPPTQGGGPGEITWGEAFNVLPFANLTALTTITGAQLTAALLNGFAPACDPAFPGGTGRFPQVSGLKITYHCSGTTPVVDSVGRAPDGPGGTITPIGPADTIRIVTNDFMLGGGDGYTALAGGTDECSRSDARCARGVHPRQLAGLRGGRGPDRQGLNADGLAGAQAPASPSRAAYSAACVRSLRSSLASTWPTCVLTVFSATPSSSAMRLFERPCAISRRTSSSRGVRTSSARGRPPRRQLLHDAGDHGGGERGLAGVRRPDRADELRRLGVLEQEPGRARPQRGEQPVVLAEARQDEHARVRHALAQDAQRGDAVEPRHREVEQHDVGRLRARPRRRPPRRRPPRPTTSTSSCSSR